MKTGLAFLLGLFLTSQMEDHPRGTWKMTADMSEARVYHTQTLLKNGEVLVTGGGGLPNPDHPSSNPNAEIFNEESGSWRKVAPMNASRLSHTATRLHSGKVLVVGGQTFPKNLKQGESGIILTSAEIFDPETGEWKPVGSMPEPRSDHRATLLPNGKVLITGGYSAAVGSEMKLMSSALLFDPETETFTPTNSMHEARLAHSATLLFSKKVLVVGGTNFTASTDAEIYDPDTEKWSRTGNLNVGRLYHEAVLLKPFGKVLIIGGQIQGDTNTIKSEIYDPRAGTFQLAAENINSVGKSSMGSVRMNNWDVMIAGNGSITDPVKTVEIYSPRKHVWKTTGSMNVARGSIQLTLLYSGKILATGGAIVDEQGKQTVAKSAELFGP